MIGLLHCLRYSNLNVVSPTEVYNGYYSMHVGYRLILLQRTAQ